MRHRLSLGVGMLVLFAACLFAGTASAQTSAGILGQVKDESGAVLPGVTVTVSSPALQVTEVSDVTNAQGEYRLTPLPIGTYVVIYALTGFETIRREGVRLDIGMQAKLDVAMKIGTIAETVTVSGAAPVVDVTATSASTQFTRDTLELTPTSRNGAISLMVQAPGVRSLTLDVGGGAVGNTPEFSSFGQPTESYMMMEGIVTSDTRISSQGGNYFDYNAMEEAKVQTISNGPEIPSRGPALTMLLKSGGNEFHGGGEFAFTSQRFESNNVDAALRAKGVTQGSPLNYRRDQGADLGGRIVPNKLWFYGAVRYRPQDLFQLGGVKPDGTPADAYRGETLLNEKFSYQMSQSNKLVFWGQWAQKYHYGENVSQFVAWESRSDRKPPVRTNTWKAEWQAVKGNSLVLSALFGRWTWTGGTNIGTIGTTSAATAAGVSQGLEIVMLSDDSHGGNRPSTYDQTTLQQAGRATSGGSWNDIWRYTSKATLSWYKPDLFAGNHDFKAGMEYTPTQFIQGNGDRGAAGQYRLIYNNGAPTQIELYNYPVIPQNNVAFMGAYGNDSWTIARRLTLDLGARFEHDTADVPKQCRQAGVWSFTAASCVNTVPFQTLNSIAPRIYFSYDVAGDARTVVKGGWGRFMKQRFVEENQMTNPYTSVTATYRWHDLNGNKLYDPGEVNDDPNGPDFISSNQPINGISNSSEKPMGTDQFALTVERQLGKNFAVRVSGVYIHTFNEQRLLNTLRPYSAFNIPITSRDPGPDGVVGTADDPGTFLTYYDYPAALAGRQNEVFQFINDQRSAETHRVIDMQVIKRISSNWQFLISYTATKNNTLVGHPSNRAANYDPNQEINTGDHTTQKTFRISGLYRLPYGVSASANFDSETGIPQARQVLLRGGAQTPTFVINACPLGCVTLPTTNVVDVRFDKSFAVGRQKVSARVNFYNLTNANQAVTWNLRSGPTYLVPTVILRPRVVEFGVSYSF
jgi:carboxypeptidase family protein